jgi:phytoene dehydrogenase-like protein
MAEYQLIIIGGGLSGLAAGIRSARFGQKTLIVEQHSLPGGLNSYYYRQGRLLETGLHAMTNFAPPGVKQAPLNRLFRQLQLTRKAFPLHEQLESEVIFPQATLRFSNDRSLLYEEVTRLFPNCIDAFQKMVQEIESYNPFAELPWQSARAFVHAHLHYPLLENLLFLPLMVYGNAEEDDMDLGQFVIMFRAIFLEGFFRPQGTIKDLLELLLNQYKHFGGEIRFRTPVAQILSKGDRVQAIRLQNGEELEAEAILSTVGIPGTIQMSGWPLVPEHYTGRMSFTESISLVPELHIPAEHRNKTILFYNLKEEFTYRRPTQAIDSSWGVICFPDNFQGLERDKELAQIRVTNPANYDIWRQAKGQQYQDLKAECLLQTRKAVENILGDYRNNEVFHDNFTPLTIERYTGKAAGAVYGSPRKIKSGTSPWSNLFIAGTDQGYLGIVGAMLSGVTIVNQHLLK